MAKSAPTREEAEEMLDKLVERYLSIMDANDMIYAFESSRFYNPAPHLAKNKAPLLAVNSADDQVNPPELGLMEKHSVGKKRNIYPVAHHRFNQRTWDPF
jgi:homoserine O-acetyltransferase